MLGRAALSASLLLLFTVNAASAANATVTITNDHYSSSSQTVSFGEQVTWTTGAGATHHHTSTSNLPVATWGTVLAWNYDFQPNVPGSHDQTFDQAGGWMYHCAIHGSMRGTVSVPMTASSLSGPLGTTFTFNLGDKALPAGFVHDIQKRKVGGAFKTWMSPAGTAQTWKPTKRGKFQFQTRVRNTSNGQASSYSPIITITVS